MRRLLALLALGATAFLPVPATAQSTYKCLGKTATIVGTEEDDGEATNRTLYGTTGVDVTLGLGSDDIIYGWGRESFTPDEGDFLCGGEGNDSVHGFGGNDEVVGNAGHDTVTGYVGADRLIGGTGSDQVHGGAGHDWLQGGLGNDRVVDTSTGADELYGGEGDDSLDADNAQAVAHKPDFVDGGDGFDVCTVDEEDEVVNCEDVFVLRP